MQSQWLADRLTACNDHGFREIYQLGRSKPNVIDLGAGQADFDVPELIKAAAIAAMSKGENRYTPAQGIAPLRDLIKQKEFAKYGHADREVCVTVGTLGALVLSLLATVNPGEEVILFDPYFVGYPQLLGLFGIKPVFVDTYPDFQPNLNRLKAAITSKTKAILLNSPGNPTGIVANRESVKAVAELAAERNLLLMSDEIYSSFIYGTEWTSPCEFNPDTLVVTSFSKSYGMTGWRIGYAHGPKPIIDAMSSIGLMTYACAPSPAQHGLLAAYNCEIGQYVKDYEKKRDYVVKHLDKRFQCTLPNGAFYFFSQTPWGTGTEFAKACVERGVLVVPGRSFSQKDSHFRFSFSVSDETLAKGIGVLNELAKG